MKFAPYSFSKLSTFEGCPIRFKFCYIDKVEVPRPEYFKRGSKVHNALDKYRSPKYTKEMNEAISPFFSTKLGQKYKQVLDNPEVYGCRKEVRFGVDSEMKKTSYYSKTAMYRGAIDCIYVDPEGVLNLVDWKTGNVPSSSNWDQLETYALLFFKSFQKIRLTFAYVERNLERSRVLESDDYNRIKDSLITRISNVEAASTYEKNKTNLCQYCPYKEVCESLQ